MGPMLLYLKKECQRGGLGGESKVDRCVDFGVAFFKFLGFLGHALNRPANGPHYGFAKILGRVLIIPERKIHRYGD